MSVPHQQVSFEEGFAASIYKYHSIHDAWHLPEEMGI